MSPFFPPLKPDGSGMYQKGRTIPVKFVLTDPNGVLMPDATATLYVAKISDGIAGTESAARSTSAADLGNTFRYDPKGGQYIFNMSTKGMTAGTWRLRAMLDNGSEHTVDISLR